MVSTRPTPPGWLLALLALLLVAPGANAVSVLDPSDELPERVHAYGSAVVDGNIYLLGGGKGSAYVENITVVEPDGSSRVVAELPQRLKSPAAAAHDGLIYVFGGAKRSTGNDLPETVSTIHRFDPSTGNVEQLIDTQLPEPISSASAVTLNGAIYVLGGLSIQPSQQDQVDFKPSIVRFDPASEQTTRLDVQLPSGRAQASAVAVGDRILYVGGHAEASSTTCASGETTCFVDDVIQFTPGDASVGQIGELPEPVRWSAAAHLGDRVYVLGGCQANCGPHEGTAAIQTLDPSTGATDRLPVTMPVTGGRNDAHLRGDVAWVPGGVRATSEGSNDHRLVFRVQLGATKPWAPANLTAEAVEGGIQLDWDPPRYDGGGGVSGYVVERARGARTPTEIDRVRSSSYEDLNVTQGVTYTYQVRAENRQGVSSPSGEVLVRPTERPAAPAVSARGGDRKLVAQWTPPEDTGGREVTAYRVYAHPANESPELEGCQQACWGRVSNTTRKATIESVQGDRVENGETYTVRVQARNANGWGELSAPENATPKPVPDAPGGLSATPERVDGERVVNLSWSALDDESVTAYVVYRGPALDELSQATQTQDTRWTDEGPLPQGETILYAVAARNGGAEGPISLPAHVVFANPPGPVSDLTARWTGSYVQVAWEQPNATGGVPIAHYEVARTRGAMDPEEANATIHQTATQRYQDHGAPRGTPLAYHVRAVTSAGPGEWSFEQVRIPLEQDSRPPVAVLAAHPRKVDVGSRVVFDASGSDDDDGVVAYNFSFGDGAGTGWRSAPRVTHVYEEAGIYNASVIVRDVTGLEESTETTIAVGPPPDEDPTGPGDVDLNDTDPDGQNGIPLAMAPVLAALLLAAGVARRRG